jgi:uncharacterized protein (DUF1501 family)
MSMKAPKKKSRRALLKAGAAALALTLPTVHAEPLLPRHQER